MWRLECCFRLIQLLASSFFSVGNSSELCSIQEEYLLWNENDKEEEEEGKNVSATLDLRSPYRLLRQWMLPCFVLVWCAHTESACNGWMGRTKNDAVPESSEKKWKVCYFSLLHLRRHFRCFFLSPRSTEEEIACILRTHKFTILPWNPKWPEYVECKKQSENGTKGQHTIDLNIIACDSFVIFHFSSIPPLLVKSHFTSH